MKLTLASLFDGSGTAPLAASMCGITPVWASEIEPYPIRVTTKRFPNMKHYGSITDIDGAKVDPVDIICGGSPCQDLSVAGKQAGLDGGTRSHLFYEMVRIIKEMRKATDGKKPRYIVWENVPGAFSSNNGYDFMSVLQNFAEIAEADVHVPEPERKANKLVWRYAGEMVGCGWSIAWRTVDAQYWGVPQRRRRIYLVVDLDSERAGEILFERKSLSGNTEPGRETRKGTATNVGDGNKLENQTRTFGFPLGFRPENTRLLEEKSTTLCNGTRPGYACGILQTFVFENHSQDSRFKGPLSVSPALPAHIETGGNNTPFIVEKIAPVYCLQGNGIDRSETAGCNGKGWKEDVSYTLNTIDRPAVAYLASGKNTVGTLMANAGTKLWLGNQEAFSGDYHIIEQLPDENYIVRRLTPLECSRLQGFPDYWELGLETPEPTEEDIAFWAEVFETHRKIVSPDVKPRTRNQIFKWLKDPYSDSASYKMWGNGMALPNMLFVISRIKEMHDNA